MKLIAQGAESKLYLDGENIVKERFRKTYRISEIDEKLRKFRTKREAKVLDKLRSAGFPGPKLISTDEKKKIIMSNIKGKLVKGIFDKGYSRLSKEIGNIVAELHNLNIIHGDLTTSNMIYDDKLYLIDFGLSFFSHKPEDKAVDLHLLKEALESRHHKVFGKAFDIIIKNYKKKSLNSVEILDRLIKVEKRGRYKNKNG